MANCKCMYYSGWRRKVVYLYYLVSLTAVLVSIERTVFDVLGQMWLTMLVNGMNLICTMTGVLGTCVKEKIAMAVYLVWNLMSIGLNIVIVLIYHDVGLLTEKENVLGLLLGSENWWRRNGIGCDELNINDTILINDTLTGQELENCVLSYVTIETIHAAVYMFLAIVASLFILPLLCSREKTTQHLNAYAGEDDEDFSYVNITQWNDSPSRHGSRWQHSLGTNIT